MKVYNSVFFRILAKLCNHHHCLITVCFHHPKKKPIAVSCHSPISLPPRNPWKLLTYLPSLWVYLFWTIHIFRFTQYVAFCVRLLLLSLMFPGSSMLKHALVCWTINYLVTLHTAVNTIVAIALWVLPLEPKRN